MCSAVSCGPASCLTHFEGVFITDRIGLLSISVNKLQFTGNCGLHMTFITYTHANEGFKHANTHSVSYWSICLLPETYIFANKILLIFYDAPWSNANGADLSPWLGGVVFQCITHMTNHPCVCLLVCVFVCAYMWTEKQITNLVWIRSIHKLS